MHEGPFHFAAISKPPVRVFCDFGEEMPEAEALIAVEYCCPECLKTGLTFIAKAIA